MNILDECVLSGPSAQNAIDLFEGQWTMSFPPEFGLKAGTLGLYADPRVSWAIGVMGGLRGKRVLELGPLEGGHTHMLEQAGAASVLSIEANARNYVKCLITKEIFGLSAKYMLGDFNVLLEDSADHYDHCLCAGVLYHMVDPIQTLFNVGRLSNSIYIWTHYYDEAVLSKNDHIRSYFDEEVRLREFAGETYHYKVRNYREALQTAAYCGGITPTSCWMERDQLIRLLGRLGFTRVHLEHEMPDHPHGPCFSMLAMR